MQGIRMNIENVGFFWDDRDDAVCDRYNTDRELLL